MTTKKKQGKPEKHDPAFKIAIATEYLKGELGFGRLGAKYGLSLTAVCAIVKWYRKYYGEQAAADAPAAAPQSETETPEVRELKKRLELAELKAVGLEMMIEIARKELGIDIRKKSGAKQSRK